MDPIELVPGPRRRRRFSGRVALGAAVAAGVVISLITVVEDGDQIGAADDFPDLTATFVSPRNGFSIEHPAGATVTATTQDGADGFDVIDTGRDATFHGSSNTWILERLTATDEEIDRAFATGEYAPGCGVPRRRQAEITIDGLPGRIAECPNRIEATVALDEALHVFTLSHDRRDARAVFDAFVATIDLTPETMYHVPDMATTFVSPTYGFSYGYIDRGGLEPATAQWDPTDQPLDETPFDRFDFVDTGLGAGFAGASTEVPGGATVDAWVDERVTSTAAGGCGVPRSEHAPITIDGQPGGVTACVSRTSAQPRIEATVVADGRLYLFVMLHNPGTDDARAWFDAWTATIDLTPETATAP
jgi:hypothetical protein